MRTYVILKKDESGLWEQLTAQVARNDRAAIRQIDPTPGEYVAVPARSWHPRTVQVETKTALKFS